MKRLFTWKVLRRLLISIAVLITLLAVVWAVENFRGKRAWDKYKAELQAKGDTLDITELVPPPVPDEQNFALAPFFSDLVYTPQSASAGSSQPKQKPDLIGIGVDRPDTSGNHRRWIEHGVNLAEMQEFYRGNTNFPRTASPQSPAEDVLLALTRFKADLEGLHEAAAQRPYARFPIRYENNFATLLPHYVSLRQASWALLLRSTANLEMGRNEEALRDATLAFRITDSIRGEPLLISHLVWLALHEVNVQIVKEGLIRRAWSEADLAHLQGLLAKADLLGGYLLGIRGERAFSTKGLETLTEEFPVLRDVPGASTFQAGRLLPRGWIHQNQLSIARWIENHMLPVVNAKTRRVYPEVAAKAASSVEQMKKNLRPYTFFAQLMVPAVAKVSIRTAEMQTKMDQAILACALERFRLTHKQYPETLQQLVPEFIATIPNDLITGETMKYARTADGAYKLYAVGWDGKDNGGLPALTDKPSRKEEAGRDWVWQIPAIRE